MDKPWEAEFTFRPNSQDALVVRDVLLGNEYGLPREMGLADVVIDVGAHIGCFAVDALRRGAGRVVCLEPDPANFALLRRNVAPYDAPPGRVEVHQEALAARRGAAAFLSRGPHTAMGFLHPTGGVGALCVTLDDLLAHYPCVAFLKLDCEGAEWAALSSCTLLSRCASIRAEMHNVSQRRLEFERIVGRLRELGFEVEARPQAAHDDCWLLRADRRGE